LELVEQITVSGVNLDDLETGFALLTTVVNSA
jgi:hypothetical protein